ncbi:mandelate racemase/muconate lactonizing enzyme family protein [Chelativorans sp. AA-79]|uniref:mandelate racemase/muconate lactonizing enzyme family protein n=1 Tax=Chelativorans sp. AA-79 TaxID=3028735 RepID=UPI0023F85D34|nr:mandelate racemase/muconate lactonizing enzyme family protein [Chelativorans sp. AA-79]WEX10926.1 mandelate racemase/muconate lactonizing enzyme family protein [Chelativorans sp. AA-79]
MAGDGYLQEHAIVAHSPTTSAIATGAKHIMKISRITCSAFRMPLKQAVSSSRVTMTHRELVVVEVEVDNGEIGVGWCTTAGVGAAAVHALISGYLAPMLLGSDPRNTEQIWQRLWMECHAAGPGGITTLAISAIDIAMWDIKAKNAGEPLYRLLGGARTSVQVYASAINLHLSMEDLVEQVRAQSSDGYTAFKIKVGRPGLYEDRERCLAIRKIIGDNGCLMLDANQKWSVGEATQRIRILLDAAPLFIEEPLLSDDVGGHMKLRNATGMPIAVGEQLCNRFEFWNYVHDGATDYLQPDVWKVGGITEFLKIAALGAAAGLPISPHGAMELSVHLAAALPNALHVENIFGLNLFDFGATSGPMAIANGRYVLGSGRGHGVTFSAAALEEHKLSLGEAIEREPLYAFS